MANSDSQDNGAHPKGEWNTSEDVTPVSTQLDQNDLYYSLKKGRGLAIIINHEVFDEIDVYSHGRRRGTVRDLEILKKTFSDLGFEIDLQENKTYKQIMDHISQVSRMDELKDYDCLVVFVLTHGSECETICAKDGTYYVKELVEPFTGRNCIQLANKPKLFFIQACKGTKLQRGIRLRVVTDSGQVTVVSKTCVMYSIPEISDVLVAYATMEGYAAVRCPATGSPYIQFLCEELGSCGAKEDLLTILIRVHRRVANKEFRYHPTEDVIKVQPSFLCYLTRFVRFDAPTSIPQTFHM
jgi:caspase-like apoptosis-related cysteine protease